MQQNINVIGPIQSYKSLMEVVTLVVEDLKTNLVSQMHIQMGSTLGYEFEGYSYIIVEAGTSVTVPTISVKKTSEEEHIEFVLPKAAPLASLGIVSEDYPWLRFAVEQPSLSGAGDLLDDIASNKLSLKDAAVVFGIAESKLESDLRKAELYKNNPTDNHHLAEYEFLYPAILHDSDASSFYVNIPAYIVWTLRASLFEQGTSQIT